MNKVKDNIVNVKVSIIIPIYNVENYLEECLNSIIEQTLNEIEIICIDDCSTDNSYKILERYKNIDSRFVILRNIKNIGPGPTRNIGIKLARGDYIGFVDSDDYISLNYFESLYYTGKHFNSDLVNTLNMIRFPNSDNNMNITNFNDKLEYTSICSLDNIGAINSIYMINNNPVNKLFRRDFILHNNIFYMDNNIGMAEDLDFIIRVLAHNPSISFNNNACYYYRHNLNSSCYNAIFDKKYFFSLLDHLNNSICYLIKLGVNLPFSLVFYIFSTLLSNFSNYKGGDKVEIYYLFHKFVVNNIFINDLFIDSNNVMLYEEYLLIKNNNTYDKYLYNRYLFNKINTIQSQIVNFDNKIYHFTNKLHLLAIYNFPDKIIIYFLFVKISIKKKIINKKGSK